MSLDLSQVRIVLVEPTHPGNIGGAARAMKNMMLSQLVLVNPRLFPAADATARAAGADDVLAAVTVHATLQEALAGCRYVVGTSARLRRIEWPQVDARAAGPLVVRELSVGPVAVVFGREHSGLTNDEMALCHALLHVPTNPEFSSLNLAAAVQIVAYEIALAAQAAVAAPSPTAAIAVAVEASEAQGEPASADEMESMYQHMFKALTDIGYLKPPSCEKLMRRLRRLFNRTRPDMIEINMLRGIFSAAQGRKYDWRRRAEGSVNAPPSDQ